MKSIKVTIKAEFEVWYDESEIVSPSTTAIIDFTEKVVKKLDEDFALKKVGAEEHWEK